MLDKRPAFLATMFRKMFRLEADPPGSSERNLRAARQLLAAWQAELARGNRRASAEIARLKADIAELENGK